MEQSTSNIMYFSLAKKLYPESGYYAETGKKEWSVVIIRDESCRFNPRSCSKEGYFDEFLDKQ